MTSTILYFTFLTNYIYLILILWHQMSAYRIYVLNLALASILNIFCIAYQRNNLFLFFINLLLFFLLLVLPLWLTKLINNSLAQAKIDHKTLFWAKLRYSLTQSSFHRSEYLELKEAAFFYQNNADSAHSAFENKPKEHLWTLCWKKYPVTMVLMISNALFFILAEIYKQDQGFLAFLNLGVNSFEFVFYEKEYWRLMSSMFLHFDYLHLGMNLFGLYCMSPFLERVYGKRNFLLIYLGCGLLSSLASIWWRAYQITLSMGASGAICGLMGAYFFLFQKKDVSLQFKNHQIFSFWFTVATFAVIGYFIPQMDNAAHFCGLFSGVLFSYLLRKNWIFLERVLLLVLLFALGWSFSCQMANIFENSYPQDINRVAWYSLSRKQEKVLFSVPFTWKPDFSLNQKKFTLYPKEKPFSLTSQDAIFWDTYHLGSKGEIFIKMSIVSFSLRDQIRMGVEELRYKLQNTEQFKESISSLQRMGENLYYYTEENFSLHSSGKKVNMVAAYYFISHKNSVYQWRFQYPEKQRKQYESLVKRILADVYFF
ncbi:MAG: rhomboid family intramembrane serine protease [Candidatus Brocadiae bacterium]|nr:rhomboid family intramembrane serine protease [Candidatus Brocadiia bacterium]